MTHTIYRLLSLLLPALLLCAPAGDIVAKSKKAPKPLDVDSVATQTILLNGKAKTAALKSITDAYSSWSSAEMSGKITSIKFFIKPSVKLYMKRGAELLLSVRVPLKGEVARLEADRDSLLIVNKLNRTYLHESLETVSRIADVTLSDIQDLFLGRLFIAGRGTLSKKDGKRVDIYQKGSDWLVVPSEQHEASLVHYGFSADDKGRALLLMISSMVDESNAELDYTYKGKQRTLEFTLERKGRPFGLTVEFDAVKWGAKGFERIGIPKGYEQLSPREFMPAIRNMKL